MNCTESVSEAIRQREYIAKMRELTEKREAQIGRKLRYHIETFGCQMNARDSEKLAGILREIGYVEEAREDQADFVLYGPGKCKLSDLRTPRNPEFCEKTFESRPSDRGLRLYDAGTGRSADDPGKVPFCQPRIRHT